MKPAAQAAPSIFGGSSFGSSSFGSSSFGSAAVKPENPFSRPADPVETSEKEPSGFGGFARRNSGPTTGFAQPFEQTGSRSTFGSSETSSVQPSETGSIFGSSSGSSFSFAAKTGSEPLTSLAETGSSSIFGSSKSGSSFGFGSKTSPFGVVKEDNQIPASSFGGATDTGDTPSSGLKNTVFGAQSSNPFASSVTKPLFEPKEPEPATEAVAESNLPKKTSAVLIIHGLTDEIRNARFIQSNLKRFGTIAQIRLVSSKQAAKGTVFRTTGQLCHKSLS